MRKQTIFRVLKAAQIAIEEGNLYTISFREQRDDKRIKRRNRLDAKLLIDPKTEERDERRLRYAQAYWESRKRRGELLDAQKWMRERNYFLQ